MDLAPPTRFWGLCEIVSSVAIAWLLFLSLNSITGTLVLSTVQAAIRDPANFWRQMSPETACLVAILAFFTVIAGIRSLFGLLIGLRHLLRISHPVVKLGEINDGPGAMRDLFQNRAIQFRSASTGSAYAAIPRFRYLTRPQSALLEDLGKSIVLWALLFGLAFAPHYLPSSPSFLRLPVEAFLPLGAIALFASVVRILAALVTLRKRPSVKVVEDRIHVANGGNPVDMYLQVQRVLNEVRLRDFPNRELLARKPNLGRSHHGDTDSFTAELMLERQPEPLKRGIAFNAMILDVGAVCLRTGAFALALLSLRDGGIVPNLLTWFACLIALSIAGRFRTLGYLLHHVFRFRSDVYWLKLEGTYSVGHSGLGDGRGGMLYVERAHTQSRFDIVAYGACVVTEAVRVDGARVVVDSIDDPGFRTRCEHLASSLESMEGRGEKLPSIDISDGPLRDMVGFNAKVEQLQSQARLMAQSESAPRLQAAEIRALPAETKECPRCAETIKWAAKVCRFCQYQFESPEEPTRPLA